MSDLEMAPRGFTLRDFARVIFKRKWTIALCFLSTVATVAFISIKFTKPMYRAVGQIMLTPGREHTSDPNLPGALRIPRVDFNMDDQGPRALDMLTGHNLAEQVVTTIGPKTLYRDLDRPASGWWNSLFPSETDDRSVFDSAVSRFQENIGAEIIGKSTLITLTFKHEDAEGAANAINTLISAYLDRYLALNRNPRGDAFFEEQFEQTKRKMATAAKEMEDFKVRHHLTASVKEEQEATKKELAAIQAEYADTSSKQVEAEARSEQARAQMSTVRPPATTSVTPVPSRNAEIAKLLRDKLVGLELQESELAHKYSDEHPTLQHLRDEIAALRDKIAKTDDGTGGVHTTTINHGDGTLYYRLQEEVLKSETESKSLRARKASIGPRIADVRKRIEDLDRLDAEFSRLQDRLQLEDQNYRAYLARAEEARLSNAMDAEKLASVKVIERAKAPLHPLNAKLGLKMLMAVLFGLIGGLGLAFVREMWSDRFETVDDVESYLGLPVLASVPKFRLKM